MTEPENHPDIGYYYVGQAERTVFSAHRSQQIEESHHREGRREWLDGHVCEPRLYSAISSLCTTDRSEILGAKWTMKGGRFVSSGHKGQKFKGVNMTLSSRAIKQTNAAQGLSKQRQWPTRPLAAAAELFLNNLLSRIWENLVTHHTLQCFEEGFCFKWHFLPSPSAMHSLPKESQWCCSFNWEQWLAPSRGHSWRQGRAAGTAFAPLRCSEPILPKTKWDQNMV